MDEAHDTLSGPATRRMLEREYAEYGKKEYQRLAGISVAHLYNRRKQSGYRERRLYYTKTCPTPVDMGERRKPEPEGRPGYLRVDTVHQGDRDGVKGVYHINAMDEITQWQVMACVPQISEAFLLPALEQILQQFPFAIRGFHSDNGSEYVNRSVAQLLNKLLIEQTKSRPRRSNDNGLVETKRRGAATPKPRSICKWPNRKFSPASGKAPRPLLDSFKTTKRKERSSAIASHLLQAHLVLENTQTEWVVYAKQPFGGPR